MRSLEPLKVVNVGLLCMLLVPFSQSASIHSSERANEELVHSSANSGGASVSDSFSQFQEVLSSVFLLENPSNAYESSDDIFIIPKDQINDRVLNSLGFREEVKYSKKFKLSNNAFQINLDVLIPESTAPLFVFNTSDPLKIPKEQTRADYASFLESNAPFELPEFSALVDYFLILPIPERFNSRVSQAEVVSAKISSLPMFKHSSSPESPLLVFLFKSGNKVAEAKELNLPLVGIKNYLGSNDLNAFFDLFAKSWVERVGLSPLVHGSFCTLNLEHTKDSFCIQIKEDLRNLLLYPAFNQHQPRPSAPKEQEGTDKTDMKESLKKAKRDGSSPKALYRVSSSVDDDFTELILPLSIMKTNDTQSTESYTPRGKGYTQVVSKLKSSLRKIHKRRHEDDEFTKAKVEDIRDKLEQRLKQKHLRDKKIKENKATHVVSKASKSYEDDDLRDGGTVRQSLIKTPAKKGHKLADVYSGSKGSGRFVEENNEAVKEWEKTREKKVVDDIKLKSTTAPSFRHTSDEVQGDCEPITWFNVFHHSVFGKTKFCGV